MDMSMDNNRQFFIVISENGGSDFVGANSLSKFGSHKLRMKELIQLDAGELYIPLRQPHLHGKIAAVFRSNSLTIPLK